MWSRRRDLPPPSDVGSRLSARAHNQVITRPNAPPTSFCCLRGLPSSKCPTALVTLEDVSLGIQVLLRCALAAKVSITVLTVLSYFSDFFWIDLPACDGYGAALSRSIASSTHFPGQCTPQVNARSLPKTSTPTLYFHVISLAVSNPCKRETRGGMVV
jgi:hypothetical protein